MEPRKNRLRFFGFVLNEFSVNLVLKIPWS